MGELNKVLAEAVDTLRAGAVELPPIPTEDDGGGYDDSGEDLDGAGDIPVIARPGRDEWVTLHRSAAIRVRLIRRQVPGPAYRVEHFYPLPAVRRDLADEVKPFTVMPAFSWLRRKPFLFVVPVAEPGVTGWGDSLLALLAKPAEWHAAHAVRVRSDREAARYRIRVKPAPGPVSWPAGTTNELLAVAIGESGFIRSAAHPVFQTLTEGKDLS